MPPLDVDDAYRRWFPIIRDKCARMVRSDVLAQDLAQETFTRLWSERHELERPEAALAWVYRTATRLAIDRHRRDRPIADEPDATSAAVDPGAGPDRQAETRELLLRLVRWLPARELEVVVLHRVDGLTQPEIATVLGSSERTVRRLLDRAQQRLDRWEGKAA